MANDKLYWFKFRDDFFDQHEIKILQEQAFGDLKVLFYIKLLAESVTHGGELRFSAHRPYNNDDLAAITGAGLNIVNETIDFLKDYGLLEVKEDGTLCLTQIKEFIGCETTGAEKKREYRARKNKFNDIEQRENEDIFEQLMNK